MVQLRDVSGQRFRQRLAVGATSGELLYGAHIHFFSILHAYLRHTSAPRRRSIDCYLVMLL